MRILTIVLLAFIFSSCGEIAPPEHFEVEIPVTKTFPEYSYQLDPYHEFLDEIPAMLVYVQGHQIMVEQSVAVGEIGAIPYAFDIKSIDTIYYKQEGEKKIRYTVQNIEDTPSFMQKQYTFEMYDGFLIVDNKHIYCTNKSANKAIELIDKGIISQRNPYVYTIARMETLDSIAKKFKTNEDMLLKWNPHLKYGYTIGAQVRIHWVPTELQ